MDKHTKASRKPASGSSITTGSPSAKPIGPTGPPPQRGGNITKSRK